MGESNPYAQLTGVLDVWAGPVGETVPLPDAAPAGNWVRLAATNGDQKMKLGGALTYFSDNDHQGPTAARRPEESGVHTFTLVGLTLENQARILHSLAKVSVPGANRKKIPLKRGRVPTEYALLLRGLAISPYGVFAGQYVIPRGVFDGEPEQTWGEDKRVELLCEFHALEDDNQAADDRLGWLDVKTA